MNKDIKKIEDKITDIIEKNEDSVKGYEKASENAKEASIKAYFEKKATERRRFISQLRNASPELKLGDAEVDGTAKGAMHRSWMDMKAFFSGDNDESILEEAVRGDRAAIKEYNKVLAEPLIPHSVKEIIREQKEVIQNDLNTSLILEDYR